MALGAACSSPDGADSAAPPPPPVANPPSLTCVEGISRATVNAAGMTRHLRCAAGDRRPGHGQRDVLAGIGSRPSRSARRQVTCTATDSLNRTGTCSFHVTVSKLAQLSRTRYLAFGDSITAGEVTFPVGSLADPARPRITKQVVVPSAAYPTVLLRTLQGRYASQASCDRASPITASAARRPSTRATASSAALNTVRPEVVLLLMHGAQRHSRRRGRRRERRGQRDAHLASRKRACAACACSSRRLPPARPGGNRTIAQFCSTTTTNRMRRARRTAKARCWSTSTPRCCRTCTRYIGVDGLHPNEVGYAQDRRPLLPGDSGHTSKCDSLSAAWLHLRRATVDKPDGAVVVAEHLTRVFDDRVAVRDVSLSVNAGEIVTLLGPNGAGKTTTMRMLAGLILPTAGRISIDGIELTEATAGPARGSGRTAHRSARALGAACRSASTC